MSVNIKIERAQLKKNVQAFKKLDKDIGMYSKAIKKLRERKDNVYGEIFKSMQKLNMPTIKIDAEGSTISTCIKKKREGLNKKFIQGRLQTYCRDNRLDFSELNDYIYNKDHRRVTEQLGLKKSKAKKSNKK